MILTSILHEKENHPIIKFLKSIYDFLNSPLIIFRRCGFMGEDAKRVECLLDKLDKAQKEIFIWKSFLEHSPVSMWLVNEEHRLVYCNNYWRKVFGGNSCIGSTPEDYQFLTEEEAKKMMDANDKALNHGDITFIETTGTFDGKIRKFQTVKFPIKPNGVTYIGGFSIDMTDILETKEDYEDIKKRYDAILNELRCSFFRTNIDGEFTLVSPTVVKMFDLSSVDEMTGMNVLKIYRKPEDRGRMIAIIQEKGIVRSFPILFKSKTGRDIYILLDAHIIKDVQGNFLGTEGLFKSVSFDDWRRRYLNLPEEERVGDLNDSI